MQKFSCTCGAIVWSDGANVAQCDSCGQRFAAKPTTPSSRATPKPSRRQISPAIQRELDAQRAKGLPMASNPCAAELDTLFYLRRNLGAHKRTIRVLAAGSFVCLLGAIFLASGDKALGLAGVAALAAGLALTGFGVGRLRKQLRWSRQKFRWGCVIPAVVIGRHPWKIAVHTDLRKGRQNRPAVKVISAKLDLLPGGPPEVGQRLACVATYGGRPRETAWSNFFPAVVGLGIKSQAEVAAITGTIGEDDWQEAQRAIAALPAREFGLYRMWQA